MRLLGCLAPTGYRYNNLYRAILIPIPTTAVTITVPPNIAELGARPVRRLHPRTATAIAAAGTRNGTPIHKSTATSRKRVTVGRWGPAKAMVATERAYAVIPVAAAKATTLTSESVFTTPPLQGLRRRSLVGQPNDQRNLRAGLARAVRKQGP